MLPRSHFLCGVHAVLSLHAATVSHWRPHSNKQLRVNSERFGYGTLWGPPGACRPAGGDHAKSGEQVVETAVEARGGFLGRPVLLVLVVSVVLAGLAMIATYAGVIKF